MDLRLDFHESLEDCRRAAAAVGGSKARWRWTPAALSAGQRSRRPSR